MIQTVNRMEEQQLHRYHDQYGVLVVDTASLNGHGTQKVMTLMWSHANEPPSLLEVVALNPDLTLAANQGANQRGNWPAERLLIQVNRVLHKYGIQRCQVVGLCCDNASVSKTLAELMSVRFIGCNAYIASLFMEAIFKQFDTVNSMISDISAMLMDHVCA